MYWGTAPWKFMLGKGRKRGAPEIGVTPLTPLSVALLWKGYYSTVAFLLVFPPYISPLQSSRWKGYSLLPQRGTWKCEKQNQPGFLDSQLLASSCLNSRGIKRSFRTVRRFREA